jgi:hypothetical protein
MPIDDKYLFGDHALGSIKTDPAVASDLKDFFLKTNGRVSSVRAFEYFMELGGVLAEVDMAATNHKVRQAANELIRPFLGYSLDKSIELTSTLDRGQIESAYARASSILASVLHVKALTILHVDVDEPTVGQKLGLGVYIDRAPKELVNNPKGLEAAWADGFWSIANPGTLSMVVAVPRSYVRNLMINVQSVTRDDLVDPAQSPTVPLFPSFCVDKLYADLVLAFFTAIYTERHRLRSLAQMFAHQAVIEGCSAVINAFRDGASEECAQIIKAKRQEFGTLIDRNFGTELEQNTHSVPDAAQFILRAGRYGDNNRPVNPYEYYDVFVNVSSAEAETLAWKLPYLARFIDTDERVFRDFKWNSTLASVALYEGPRNTEEVNSILRKLQVVRILPVILYTVYVLADGANNRDVIEIMGHVGEYYLSDGVYTPIQRSLSQAITYLKDEWYRALAHPLKNTAEIRRVAGEVITHVDHYED